MSTTYYANPEFGVILGADLIDIETITEGIQHEFIEDGKILLSCKSFNRLKNFIKEKCNLEIDLKYTTEELEAI